MVAVIIPAMRLAPLLLSTMCTWNDRCASPIMHGDRGDRFARGNGLRSHNVEFKDGDWTCEECGASKDFEHRFGLWLAMLVSAYAPFVDEATGELDWMEESRY